MLLRVKCREASIIYNATREFVTHGNRLYSDTLTLFEGPAVPNTLTYLYRYAKVQKFRVVGLGYGSLKHNGLSKFST